MTTKAAHEPFYGIDVVATVDSGIPLVIADAEGHRLTPSVVHFPSPDTEPLVGHPANRVRVLKPAETAATVPHIRLDEQGRPWPLEPPYVGCYIQTGFKPPVSNE